MDFSGYFHTTARHIRQTCARIPTCANFYTLCGLLMLVSEIWKQLTLTFTVNHGNYSWWHFPFQLCSIPMYVCLTVGFLSSKRPRSLIPYLKVHGDRLCSFLAAFLMDFGLLGGVFAFFDTSGMHYGYLPLTIHSFAWHILLVILGCYSGLNKNTCRTLSGYGFSVMLYLVCCGIATIFNLIFHQFGMVNLFYISPHYYMQQKVFSQIADTFGNGFGIAAYIAASIAGAGIFHFLWGRLAK